MADEARGHFEVRMTPGPAEADGVGRTAIAKTFRGDMEGQSVGAMLSFRTERPGSAGYVLIERVSAAVAGRSGSFVLQHFGLLDCGVPEQRVVIVPDSGTDALVGITGDMSIDAAADHAYVLRYHLPDPGPSGT